MRADLLVNRAFQPFCFFRNRSFEGRSKPPGKPRGCPSTQSSDSIEARNLTDPTVRSKELFQTPAPSKTPKTQSPKPRWASPSPSEAAIYGGAFRVARGFSQKVQKSQRTRVAGATTAAPSRIYARSCLPDGIGRNDEIFAPKDEVSEEFYRPSAPRRPHEGAFFYISRTSGCAATLIEA